MAPHQTQQTDQTLAALCADVALTGPADRSAALRTRAREFTRQGLANNPLARSGQCRPRLT